jgi:hypothetical protein
MADTTPLAPTDAELDALIDQHRWDATTGRRAIARAVLARWGAQQMPASAAEFALQALVAAGHVSQELVDKAMVLPGAPQPAHSGEPVAWLSPWRADQVTTDPDAYGKHGIPLVRQQRREQPCA